MDRELDAEVSFTSRWKRKVHPRGHDPEAPVRGLRNLVHGKAKEEARETRGVTWLEDSFRSALRPRARC